MGMMRYLIPLVVVIIFASCASSTPGSPTVVPGKETRTSLTLTRSPFVLTNTPVPLTDTPIPPTETPIPTATRTATLTSSPKPTNETVWLRVVQDAVCRSGPGTVFDIQTYLNANERFLVFGRTDVSDWWVIKPGSEDAGCWISDLVVDIHGDQNAAMVLTPPPLPTEQTTQVISSGGLFYYLISENTGGPIACGDNIFSIYPGVSSKGTLEENVRAALQALFNNHAKYTNGLYNPIYQSRLNAKGVTYDPDTGVAIIQLRGNFKRPKNGCESERMRAVIWQTIYQFSAIKKANIYINDSLLGDRLYVP